MNFETATATATTDIQVRPPTTNSNQFNYDEIVAEIMLYVTPYVEQLYVSEDEANELEFYHEHFVLSNYTNFTLLVLRIIDKHNKNDYSLRGYRMNVYLGMQKDARFLDEKMNPHEIYANLPNYIVQLCDACERLYGKRHERIYKTLAFMEQTEDKVSPNLNQIIVNKDLGRYLMGFIN
ncbi:MAG: hypothetical protein RLZZ479_146 [Bacteroidota bacterium]|jgi:hypothetical protein